MGQRGRKSTADLQVVGNTEVQERPAPPSDLTSEQKGKWNGIVGDYPANHFEGRTDLLKSYCRHLVAQDHVAQLISTAEHEEKFDLTEYDKLHKMQERESGIIARLSIRLNIGHDTGRDKSPKKNKLRDWQ